jgi:hypothetical protein
VGKDARTKPGASSSVKTNESSLREVREAYRGVVFNRYAASHRAFRNWLGVVITFALLFCALVVWPYVSIQLEEQALPKRLEGLENGIATRESQIALVESALNGIDDLLGDIDQGPQKLRVFLETLGPKAEARFAQGESGGEGTASRDQTGQTPMMQQQALPDQSASDICAPIRGYQDWLRCEVRVEVGRMFDEFEDILQNRIEQSLLSLEGPSTSDTALDREKVLLTALKTDLSTLKDEMQTTLEETLSQNPDFFRRFSGKTDFFGRLREPVDEFQGKHRKQLDEKRTTLTRELGFLNTQLGEARGTQKMLSDRKEEIAARIKAIQTPFGTLPVGLNEAVLLFPILLAAGFVLCTHLLAESIHLRKRYHALWEEEYPDLADYHARQMPVVAPLWIDSQDPAQNRPLRWVLLLLPLMVFVGVVVVILAAATISDAFFQGVEMGPAILIVLYAVSLAGFAYGVWRVLTPLRT